MKKPFLIMISLLAMGQACSAQNFNITGAGARAEGMAGAFIGVADDATALVWNPAGIATLERPEASVVSRYVSNSAEVDNGRWKAEDSHSVLNFTSVAYPVHFGGRNLVLAAAYQRQIDFYRESELDRTQGGVDSFTGGFGLRLTPMISVGAAVNVWFGKMEVDTPGIPTVRADQYENHDFSGLNANLGVLLDMEGSGTPLPLRIGFSLRTPFTLADKGTILYSSQNSITNRGEFTRDWDMPPMAGIGASYRFGDNLTVAADFETRMFGDSKVKLDYSDQLGNIVSGELNMSDHRENLNEYRVGAEYLLIHDLGIFPLRAGYRNAPSLMSNYDDSEAATGQVVGSSVSFGTGIILDRMTFDVSATITKHDQILGSLAILNITDTILAASGIFYF